MRMGRREFLAGTAALAGCAGTGGRGITGSIVGASHAAGHRLRGGTWPEPSSVRDVQVVIAGGGIAGLSAGWKLRKSGFHDFELLELEAETGGNARSGECAATPYPWGAHYVPLPTREATAVRELFEELGVIEEYRDGEPVYNERFLCHAPEERLFLHGRWVEGLFPRLGLPPEEAAQEAAFRRRVREYLAWRDGEGRRAFAIPVDRSSADPELRALDRIPMTEHMDREGWTSPALRWYVDYCCRDDYGTTLGTTSAWAAWHYFCSRDTEDPEVLTWPEGNGWIARRLAQRLAGRIRTGMLVVRVTREGEGAVVDALELRTGKLTRLRARHVIYALPRFTAKHVLAGYDGPTDFSYAPWMVANLAVDRAPEGACWDNVIHDSPSLGYVVATHQALRAAPGPSVLTYYLPMASKAPAEARTEMLGRNWESWRDGVLADLRRAHPDIDRQVSSLDVMLWGHGMIRPVPGFLWGRSRAEAARPFGPVRFAHSDMSGLSIFEEAQYRGVRAAEEVMDALGHSYSSSLKA